MKVSYLKKQWWRLLLALVCLVLACVYAFQPAGETGTLKGLDQDLRNGISAACWMISCLIWGYAAIINWHEDCIQELDKKNRVLEERIEALENQAITAIEKVKPNYFRVRRKLGPDKDT